MTYSLTVNLNAPTMTVVQAIAWKVLGMLPAGTAFAIKAQPPDPVTTPTTRADGTPWTPAELRDIAEGVVSAARRNDAELVAAVKAKAEGCAR